MATYTITVTRKKGTGAAVTIDVIINQDKLIDDIDLALGQIQAATKQMRTTPKYVQISSNDDITIRYHSGIWHIAVHGMHYAATHTAKRTRIMAITPIITSDRILPADEKPNLTEEPVIATVDTDDEEKPATEEPQNYAFQRLYSPYNQRRYSRPWGAKITMDAANKLVYDFAVGSYMGDDAGGTVYVPCCYVGDVVATGQRDQRGSNTKNEMYIVNADGDFVSAEKSEVYEHLLAAQKAKNR